MWIKFRKNILIYIDDFGVFDALIERIQTLLKGSSGTPAGGPGADPEEKIKTDKAGKTCQEEVRIECQRRQISFYNYVSFYQPTLYVL